MEPNTVGTPEHHTYVSNVIVLFIPFMVCTLYIGMFMIITLFVAKFLLLLSLLLFVSRTGMTMRIGNDAISGR